MAARREAGGLTARCTHHVLVRREPQRAATLVLLRADGCETPETPRALASAGLQSEASSTAWVGDAALPLTRIAAALGDAALFDVGAAFDASAIMRRRDEAPSSWPGRLLLHVAGTRRCLIFDRTASNAELSRSFETSMADYFANDYAPATE